MNPKFGYNKSNTGNTNIPTYEIIAKLSTKSAARWRDKSYRNNLMAKLRLITSSDDYRQNMSIALKNSIKHKNACSTYSFRLKQSNKMLNNWNNEEFSNSMKLKYKNACNEERKLQQSVRSKLFHTNLDHKEKISKNLKERWDNKEERQKLCNSMKKSYLLINTETHDVKEFLGRESLAKYLGKSVSYVKTRLSGKLHDEKYKIVRKCDNLEED